MPKGIKTILVGCRLNPTHHARLQQMAEKERRPISAMLALLVEDALDQESGAHPPQPIHEPPSAPPARLEASPDLRAIGVVTTINEELRREGRNPLTGHTHSTLCRLLSTAFPDVGDLAGARAKGPSEWLAAGALTGVMRGLYPDDPEAVAMAGAAQSAAENRRRAVSRSYRKRKNAPR